MGLLEQIAEAARVAQTQDGWYTQAAQYVLELRSTQDSGLVDGNAYMVFPLGPENYRVKRVFRQSITPTLGGLVAEERGLLWREVMITGTFGLAPKTTQDTSVTPENPIGGTPLSGPGWTRRLIRNFFEQYARLKANPATGSGTRLIWHDLKHDDHWVVVPESVDVDRTTARRLQYPWSLQLKTIADADDFNTTSPTSSLADRARNVVNAVSQGLTLVSAAIQEGSRILGEVRFFVAGIDSLVDDLTTIVRSGEDFVNGVTDTISVGAAFVSSTAALTEQTLDTMEAASDLPDAVRQNYQMALDGLHAIGSQAAAFGTTYDQVTAPIARQEQGAAGDDRATLEAAAAAGPPASANQLGQQRTASTDLQQVDAGTTGRTRKFAAYTGSFEYAVRNGDTLQSIAARFLADGALWYDIAALNDLKAPYISVTGGPSVARVGDIIAIPQTQASGGAAIVGAGEGSEPGADLLGTDIELEDSRFSKPGRPAVDIAVDRRTFKDVRVVSGPANLAQALQVRVWTERGRLPLAPQYGLRRTIGVNQTEAFISLLQVDYRETISQDPRVRSVSGLRLSTVDDLVEIDVDVIPVGATTAQAISTSLV